MSRWNSSVWLWLVVITFGCKKAPEGEPRVTTSPVSGIVLIDGEPVEMVEVKCHPEPGTSEIKYPLTASTDKDGKFSMTTYEAGDGLPEGTYTLTFQALQMGFVTQDKLRGKFSDPKKSKQTVKSTGVKADVVDLGTIELKTK